MVRLTDMHFLNFYSTLKQQNRQLKVFPVLYTSSGPDVTRDINSVQNAGRNVHLRIAL